MKVSPVIYKLRAPLVMLFVCLLLFMFDSSTSLHAQESAIRAGRSGSGPGKESYEALNGKIVRSITIRVKEIFDESDLNAVYRAANQLKMNTKTEVIRQELLFKDGDVVDHFYLEESMRILRTLRYIRDPVLIPKVDGKYVDITIIVQDTWTLIPQVGYSSGAGRKQQSVGIADTNMFGYGNRAEVLYAQDENQNTLSTVLQSPRIYGTSYQGLLAYFDSNDGNEFIGSFGRPFRSLLDKNAWNISTDIADNVGSIFYGGTETYIYRQKDADFSSRYTFAAGDPELELRRYSLGYDYIDNRYSQATAKDYQELNLNPAEVSNNIEDLPVSRRYSGPVLSIDKIKPDFISAAYIDKFDRVEDYNLGERSSISFMYAPEILGSRTDTGFGSLVTGRGYRFPHTDSFVLGEFGLNSRYDAESSFSNTLARVDLRYYNVLGPKYLGGYFIGKHTIASEFFLDYGDELDKERVLYIGGDNALRGYEARTFAGDKRFALNLEDRVVFSEDIYKLVSFGAAAFAEMGSATYEPFADMFKDDLYGDVGVGLRFAFPRSSGGGVLRIDFGVPLRDGPDGSRSGEIRVIFAGGQLFSSRLRSESAGFEKANVGIGLDN